MVASGRDPAALRMPAPGRTRQVTLVDHHCHGVITTDLSRGEFENLITESGDPAPAGMSFFDSQLGLILRRWCPPVLGLAPHAAPGDYLARRRELGGAEVNRRLLRAAAVGNFLVDTGYAPGELTGPGEFAAAAGAPAHAVVRLEHIAEELAAAGTGAGEFVAGYPASLAAAVAAERAVAVKSIVAYRHGLGFEPERPSGRAVRQAAGGWLGGGEKPSAGKPSAGKPSAGKPSAGKPSAGKPSAGKPSAGKLSQGKPGVGRLSAPVLLRFLLWSAIDLGLPIQIHTGFGDRDLDLHRCNPLLLTGFIKATQPAGVPLLLLHCYPYHREAGYLAQIYPHVYCDVGLALNHTGARAHAVLAESLELTPFGKALYSSDAFGLAELHYLGAVGFRRALTRVTGEWHRDGMLTPADADRMIALIGAGNARRVYRLGEPAPAAAT